jgi:retinol dehydrogenase-12
LKIKEDFGGGPSYAQSKACDIILGVECAKRWGADGIISTSLNPGNLRSELVRDRSLFVQFLAKCAICHPAEMGAWTELYARWNLDITPGLNGCYVVPWGRLGSYNEGLRKVIEEGVGEKLWSVCEGVVGRYA